MFSVYLTWILESSYILRRVQFLQYQWLACWWSWAMMRLLRLQLLQFWRKFALQWKVFEFSKVGLRRTLLHCLPFFNSFTERVAKKKAKHKSKDSTQKRGEVYIWGQKQMRKEDREEKIGMIWRQFIEEKVEEPFSFLNHWGRTLFIYLFIFVIVIFKSQIIRRICQFEIFNECV